VRGAHQRKAQIVGCPGICHEMDSIGANGRLATQPPSRVLLDARLIWPLVIGNSCTAPRRPHVTETACGHELRPVIRTGADAMDKLLPSRESGPDGDHNSDSASTTVVRPKKTRRRVNDAERAGRDSA
jgi:hypothetical protein